MNYKNFITKFVIAILLIRRSCKNMKLHIHEVRGREAMFRSKMKWFELGEKSTKYFFNLEKNNYEKKLIREVEVENCEIISDPVQVNKEIRDFYQKMYTSKINGNNSTSAYEHNQKIDGFTEGLNIPQLNVKEQESLEKDLTLKELKDALASFADKKSPQENMDSQKNSTKLSST